MERVAGLRDELRAEAVGCLRAYKCDTLFASVTSERQGPPVKPFLPKDTPPFDGGRLFITRFA